MAFDLERLGQAIQDHGRVARVVIASVQGSCPREVGASMLVWEGGQSGTIGGGALEFELAASALLIDRARVSQHALGPDLGQCCGGAVQIVTEVFDATNIPSSENDIVARKVTGAIAKPLGVQRILTRARATGALPHVQLCDGWLVEPLQLPTRALWIWGAGHVGRALVSTLAPLPEFAITWIDTDANRFPINVPDQVTSIPTPEPARLAQHAPAHAEHLILTYSHALDLEICHQLLSHDFGIAGVIGSKTKWARFRNRLAKLGHNAAQINRITCPIGTPSLGKHPQAIAIGVATSLLDTSQTIARTQRTSA